ncbi:hypothetical protein [Arenibaculum pallidiluteum]|uniref:hypothetical protein n=1 Tax=Arenibaculum pallidiluteum TaxID=2812559 RepID=UPI001A9585A7|nr:hypothetical protein [Arenibaculum pallidiluteum]
MSRDVLIEIIAYALWKHLDLRPRRRSLDDARLWARQVVDHMELSRVEAFQGPPARPHSIP